MKKSILFAIQTLSLVVFITVPSLAYERAWKITPESEYEWSDQRVYANINSPILIINEAWANLQYYSITSPLDYDPPGDKCYPTYFSPAQPVSGPCPDANACYMEKYIENTYVNPPVVVRMRSIVIEQTLFRRGYVCIDADMELFDDDENDNSIYYNYAFDAVEALEFVLAHEICHAAGIPSGDEEVCEEFARRVILEIRRARNGYAYDFRPIFSWINDIINSYGDSTRYPKTYCNRTSGPPPRKLVH